MAVWLMLHTACGNSPYENEEPSADPNWERAMVAYYEEDYQSAVKELRPLAERGVAEAQYYLGTMYELRSGCEPR